MNVFHGYDVDIPSIIFKKKKKINRELSLIPIKYKHNNNKLDLIIQTPKLYIPFGINSYKDKNYLSLSFRNYEYDREIKTFLKTIKKLSKHIEEYIKYKWGARFHFDNNIKENEGFPPLIKITIPENINIFDDNKNTLVLDNIKPKIDCNAIIYLSHIWKNNKRFGLTWKLLQLKVYPIKMFSGYAFLDDLPVKPIENKPHNSPIISTTTNNINNNNTNKDVLLMKDHPIYSKYFKMLKYRIPISSIKSKLKMANLDENIIDLEPEQPIPSHLDNSQSNDDLDFKEINLQSVSFLEKIKKDKPDNVPTLEDILTGISSLKKTNYKLKNITISNPQKLYIHHLKDLPVIEPDKNIDNIEHNGGIGVGVPNPSDLLNGMKKLKKSNDTNSVGGVPNPSDLLNGMKKLKKSKNINNNGGGVPNPSDLLDGMKKLKKSNDTDNGGVPNPSDLLDGMKKLKKSKNINNNGGVPNPSDLLDGMKKLKKSNNINNNGSVPNPSDLLDGMKKLKKSTNTNKK